MLRVRALIKKEFRQIFRDPMMPRIIFVVPIIQLLVLGFAATTDVRNVELTVYDQDRSPSSRALLRAHQATDLFSIVHASSSPKELERSLARGEADIGLWIGEGFEQALLEGRPAPVGVYLDGRNSSMAGRAAGYASAILAREGQRLATARRAGPAPAQLVSETRFFYNPSLDSRNYMVPGIVVMLVTIISVLLTGMAVVREKEIGTLEQLMVTPITPLELIAGKTFPFMVLTFAELCFATLLALWIYGLTFAGSFLLLLGTAMLYLLVTLGGGLLVSTVSRTQQQAMFTLWFFLVFFILTSGFFYPIENMPATIKATTWLNPMRYFMTIVRAIFLKGSGLADLAAQLLPLAALGLATFGLAIRSFSKRVS